MVKISGTSVLSLANCSAKLTPNIDFGWIMAYVSGCYLFVKYIYVF